MVELDAHFHVWELDRFNYPWPCEDVKPIFKTVTFPDLTEALNSANVRNAVFVQCLNNNIEEAKWVLGSNHPCIKGVVAGVNLIDHDLTIKQLDELCSYDKFVGVRHILDEEDTDWIIRDDVIAALKIVAERGLSFDFLSRPHHLKHVETMAKAIPNLRIVIDHIAKPYLSKSLDVSPAWRKDMEAAANCPNGHCKISGLVTEVDPVSHKTAWSKDTFAAHINVVLGVFGADRCMIGSDWPVLRLTGADYATVNQLHKSLIAHLSDTDQKKIVGGNAVKFYKLCDLQ